MRWNSFLKFLRASFDTAASQVVTQEFTSFANVISLVLFYLFIHITSVFWVPAVCQDCFAPPPPQETRKQAIRVFLIGRFFSSTECRCICGKTGVRSAVISCAHIMKTNFMLHSLSCAFPVFKGPCKERKCTRPDVFVYTVRISWVSKCPDVFVYTVRISWVKCSWPLPPASWWAPSCLQWWALQSPTIWSSSTWSLGGRAPYKLPQQLQKAGVWIAARLGRELSNQGNVLKKKNQYLKSILGKMLSSEWNGWCLWRRWRMGDSQVQELSSVSSTLPQNFPCCQKPLYFVPKCTAELLPLFHHFFSLESSSVQFLLIEVISLHCLDTSSLYKF